MEVKTKTKEIIASIIVTLNEDDIKQMKKVIAMNPCSDQSLFLKTILEKANATTAKPSSTSFWYVTVCGNNHVLADAIGSIKSNLPNYKHGITSPGNWFNEREVCVGMWCEKEARVVQKFLSGQGFECSMIKAGDCH